jgi:hypothetical protein
MREEGKIVQTWVGKVDKHWAKKFGDQALDRVREQVRESDWEGEKMAVEVEVEGAESGTPHKISELMLVSTRAKTIVQTAEEVLNESMAVASAS